MPYWCILLMSRHIVTLLIMLVFLPVVFAANSTVVSPTFDINTGLPTDSANRFLAAEVTRQITTMQEAIVKSTNDYNDQNFILFDNRLSKALSDLRVKVALGVIGAALLVNALVAFFIMRTMKNYSYEKYQEKTIGKLQEAVQEKDRTIEGMNQTAHQPEWFPQKTTETMGVVYGQAAANDMSQMNAWQAVPAYQGGWQAPIPVQPEYSHVPAGYKYMDNIQDPMQSPQWTPQDGYDNQRQNNNQG